MRTGVLFGWVLAAAMAGGPVQAQAQDNAFTPPCQGKVWWAETEGSFEDFDFWLGDWQVFDRNSGELMGVDHIEKIFQGCALQQHWRQMSDRFSIPGAPWRLEGGSHTTLGADGRWHQIWIDNNGSRIPVSGGLNDDGVMVLASDWIEFNNRQGQPVKVRYRWHWAPKDDGTIHNWGQRQLGVGDNTDWATSFDIVYRRNAPGGPRAVLKSGE